MLMLNVAGTTAAAKSVGAAKIALITLAAGQFVMALDTTVMNTASATVAKDDETTVTGIPRRRTPPPA